MKTLEQLLNQPPIYLHNWSSKSDIIQDFEDTWEPEKAKELESLEKYQVNILFASYGTDNYSGDAFVLFEKEGKLYEVNGSHCSCHGLENQWEPEETTIEELTHRLVKGTMGRADYSGNEFAKELKEFLGITN